MNRSATKSRKVRTFSSGTYLERLMGELDRAAIAFRLATSRQQAGLDQAELAELLNVHWRTIQNYESPKIDRIPWDRLDEWARATGVTRDWLLHGDDAAAPATAPPDGDVLAKLDEILRRIDDLEGRLPPQERRAG